MLRLDFIAHIVYIHLYIGGHLCPKGMACLTGIQCPKGIKYPEGSVSPKGGLHPEDTLSYEYLDSSIMTCIHDVSKLLFDAQEN